MHRIILGIIALAFAGTASAASIVISGSGPVSDRTINVPGCSKLTTGVNQAKESIGVICYHIVGVPPLDQVGPPSPATTKAPAPAAAKPAKGK